MCENSLEHLLVLWWEAQVQGLELNTVPLKNDGVVASWKEILR